MVAILLNRAETWLTVRLIVETEGILTRAAPNISGGTAEQWRRSRIFRLTEELSAILMIRLLTWTGEMKDEGCWFLPV